MHVYALLAGLLPSLIWLWFWIREDANPEPKWLLTITFFGGVIAVFFAFYIEGYIANIPMDSNWKYILWAGTEEILKFIAVIVIALNSDYNDEPIDAMIYFIVVALGFSALENTLFIFQPIMGGEIAESIITGNMRFIGATLVHIVSSATVGFALGLVYYRGYLAKILAILSGLLVAIALHSSFNLSIINSTSTADTLKTFGWFWGAVVILIILFEEIKVVRPKVS